MQVLIRMALASVLLLALCVAFCLFLFWSRHYDPSEYRGDGRLEDAGPWRFPRYRIILPQMPIGGFHEHKFLINGAPTMSATLALKIHLQDSGGTYANLAESAQRVKDLPLDIRCRVLDDRGELMYAAEGTPAAWEVAASQQQLELWHPALRDLTIKRGRCYLLEIALRPADEFPMAAAITPTLLGGGSETP